MMTSTIHGTRILQLNRKKPSKRSYVLYWMQQSQRAESNHALEYAIQRANEIRQPLLVAFGLTDGYPEANLRHYAFMLQGLVETEQALRDRGIRLAVRYGRPDDVALHFGKDASVIVCDRGYLRHQKLWRKRVAAAAGCEVVQVETDVVVPVEVASDKAEIGARTLRPRIHRHIDGYLVGLRPTTLRHSSVRMNVESIALDDTKALLSRLKIDRTVGPVPIYRGGSVEAKKTLRQFIRSHLKGYADLSSRPETDAVSHMSMCLHFGQISPLYIALQVGKAKVAPRQDRDAFLEELIVRRELAHNFVNFTKDYDDFSCLPEWARSTLAKHRKDLRPHRYTTARLEAAATHDEYWNAAMREMKFTGYMHNYMRMYWGKKILEWSPTPEHAFRTILKLNNKYFIDGRDPNSYANVGWIFGLHDRPWPERPIFGNVRSMTASGLERKADPRAYVRKVDELLQEVGVGGGPLAIS